MSLCGKTLSITGGRGGGDGDEEDDDGDSRGDEEDDEGGRAWSYVSWPGGED